MSTTLNQRCPGCFQVEGAANPCSHCGFDDTAPRPVQALPLRTRLNNQFIVGRVLGKPGGFGITYLAWDQMLEATVAIKEYLPRELAVRAQDSRTLHPHSSEETELFRYGLEQFLAEARTLAKLDHPNLVRVRHFFEANGTAYLVMDYYQGCSLQEHLERLPGSRLPEADALALMQPILDGLRAVHAKGFLHRDIKPQNIYLAQTDTGGVRPILLDFGAARQAMGERSRSLSVVISPGYAPFEQYQRKGQQTAATDIYGAAAVLYRMLTGTAPPEATDRMGGEALRQAVEFSVSQPLSDALNQALAMKRDFRPYSVDVFQRILSQQVLVDSVGSNGASPWAQGNSKNFKENRYPQPACFSGTSPIPPVLHTPDQGKDNGLPFSYYLGIECNPPPAPDMEPVLQALCIAPFGAAVGAICSPPQEFGLICGESVRFRLFRSSVRREDQPGDLLEEWLEEELMELENIETIVVAEGRVSGVLVPVCLQVSITDRQTLAVLFIDLITGKPLNFQLDVPLGSSFNFQASDP